MAQNEIDMEQNEINGTDGMTDYQKLQMTQISYLDFENMEQIKGKKVSELGSHLSNPDLWAQGVQFNENPDGVMNQAANKLMQKVIGEDHFITDQQLYDQCIEAGFGDLRVKDVISDKETGFQAMALEDSQGNVYFSFRGSDVDVTKGMQHDWSEANVKEFFLGSDGKQQQQAVEFFDKNKSETGQNMVYGHSLGGNLTSHVFLQRESEISEAFCYNANPVSKREIDTQAKQDAVQSERFTFAVTEGDVVSSFKDTELYAKRTTYIQSCVDNGTVLHSHLATAASFNQDGSFKETTQTAHEEFRDNSKAVSAVLGVTHKIDEMLTNHPVLAEAIATICNGQWPTGLTESVKELGPEAQEWINGVQDAFFQGGQDVQFIEPDQLQSMFMSMSGMQPTPTMDIAGMSQIMNTTIPQLDDLLTPQFDSMMPNQLDGLFDLDKSSTGILQQIDGFLNPDLDGLAPLDGLSPADDVTGLMMEDVEDLVNDVVDDLGEIDLVPPWEK